jgi:hypothetical protein
MFAQIPNTPGGLATSLTTFATAMAALSVAAERVTSTIKQWFNPKPGSALSFLGSDWFTQVLAFLSGVLVIWLSGQDPITLIGVGTAQAVGGPAAGQGSVSLVHLAFGGLLVSGGSATWNHILDILQAAKVQKENTVNSKLPPNQQIAS